MGIMGNVPANSVFCSRERVGANEIVLGLACCGVNVADGAVVVVPLVDGAVQVNGGGAPLLGFSYLKKLKKYKKN